jgi:chaperonin GroEL
MQLDRGSVSPYLFTDPQTMSCELEDASVFLTDLKFTDAQEILPLLEKFVQSGRKNLFIVAEDVDGEALGTLVVNKIRGIVNPAVIKAPAYGDRRKAILEDLAILTKAELLAKDLGQDLEKTDLSVLGSARRVVVRKDDTTIVEGAGSKRAIAARIEQIRAQMETTDSDYDREKLQERAAKLSGGVAVLRVGAPTEVELKEKKHRVEDALSATKAAVEEGIVAGAGTAFLRATRAVDRVAKQLRGDEAMGARIVGSALPVPLRQIASNAGEIGEIIVERASNATGPNGYNANTGKIEDLTVVGVVDPAKVVRAGLQNAGSVAMMVLSTETLIADMPETKPAAAPVPPPEF